MFTNDNLSKKQMTRGMEQEESSRYFTDKEPQQFQFLSVPLKLFTDEKYMVLSSDAKLLYAMLLNRTNLSRKNHLIDKENHVYIYYSIEEIAADLNCGRNKAIKVLQELDTEKGIGLVRKVRRGQGKGSLLYVLDFFDKNQKTTNQTADEKDNVCILDLKKSRNQTSKIPILNL